MFDLARGARIKAVREYREFTQEELWKLVLGKTGRPVGVASIWRWEHGAGARIDDMLSLFQVLNIDSGWILGTRRDPLTRRGEPIEGLYVKRARREKAT